MQRFVETFDDPAYAVDRGLIITAWNHPAEQAFGWAAEDVIGRSADERLRPSYDWQTRRARVAAMVAAGWWAGPTVLLDRHETPLAFEGVCWGTGENGTRSYLTVLHATATGWSVEDIRLQIPGSVNTSPESGGSNAAHAQQFCAGGEGLRAQQCSAVDTEKSPRKVRIAAQIKYRRRALGLTQDDVAAELSIDRRHVSHWETAAWEPSWRNLEALAAMFDCDISDFYAPLPDANGQEAAA